MFAAVTVMMEEKEEEEMWKWGSGAGSSFYRGGTCDTDFRGVVQGHPANTQAVPFPLPWYLLGEASFGPKCSLHSRVDGSPNPRCCFKSAFHALCVLGPRVGADKCADEKWKEVGQTGAVWVPCSTCLSVVRGAGAQGPCRSFFGAKL